MIIDRLLSGINGMVVPVQRFGANVRVAALEQEALALGINKTKLTMTQQERILTRLNIIFKAAGRAGIVWQARREYFTLASVLRGLGASARVAMFSIGQQLGPAVSGLAQAAILALAAFSKFIERNRSLVVVVAASLITFT